jgi:hypothetical protein
MQRQNFVMMVSRGRMGNAHHMLVFLTVLEQ